jgi:hypothetical protein
VPRNSDHLQFGLTETSRHPVCLPLCTVGSVLQNASNNLESSVISRSCEYERGVSSHVSVLIVQIRFELFENSTIAHLHKLLRHLKLLPEDVTSFELLDQCGNWQALLPGRQKRHAEKK